MDWMIYGANGYTGELLAREAQRRGLRPILGGRRLEAIEPLARELNLSSRAFPLSNPSLVAEGLRGIGLVLHCAGPFSATSAPMIEACLAAGAHYLDITGEIPVFEHVHAPAQQQRAATANVVLCPGVGFDVIPTDCLAAALHAALPDATELALGFDSRSLLSPGTAKTSVEGLGQGGKIRSDGAIRTVPLAHEVRHIDFGDGVKTAMTIPWGDVSTAFHSTGIPNIRVFMATPPALIANARRANHLLWLLRRPWVQAFLKKRLAKRARGPSAAERAALATYVWGEVRNARGEVRTARIKTANGYALTVTGALAVTEFLLQNRPAGGSYTPSRLMGAEFVTRLPGSGPLRIAAG